MGAGTVGVVPGRAGVWARSVLGSGRGARGRGVQPSLALFPAWERCFEHAYKQFV
jgi:hypothetical protein